jgi:hypothetical protein
MNGNLFFFSAIDPKEFLGQSRKRQVDLGSFNGKINPFIITERFRSTIFTLSYYPWNIIRLNVLKTKNHLEAPENENPSPLNFNPFFQPNQGPTNSTPSKREIQHQWDQCLRKNG